MLTYIIQPILICIWYKICIPFEFVLLHSRATQDDPNAWSYDCTVDDLHAHMVESKIYEKQNLITEKNIRSLYRLLHLGIYQNKVHQEFMIHNLWTISYDSLKYKFRYCHIGIKTEFASLVMPPTQLRPLLARGQIKQCKMDI